MLSFCKELKSPFSSHALVDYFPLHLAHQMNMLSMGIMFWLPCIFYLFLHVDGRMCERQ